MHPPAWLKPALIVCTVASLGAAASFALPYKETPGPPLPAVGAAAPHATAQPANADSLARVIAGRDAFRAARRPAGARFNSEAGAPGAPPPPVVQRPQLSLSGVVLGGEPAALVDGIPGTEGTRVLRVGERVGDYVVRQIAPDRVVIASRDTTWTLRMRIRFQ